MKYVDYGKVVYDGKTYILTDDALMTGRSLNNGQDFNNKSEGEIYEFEMSASANDEDGNKYVVYWIFEDVKGEGGKDLDDFDYSKVDRIESI